MAMEDNNMKKWVSILCVFVIFCVPFSVFAIDTIDYYGVGPTGAPLTSEIRNYVYVRDSPSATISRNFSVQFPDPISNNTRITFSLIYFFGEVTPNNPSITINSSATYNLTSDNSNLVRGATRDFRAFFVEYLLPENQSQSSLNTPYWGKDLSIQYLLTTYTFDLSNFGIDSISRIDISNFVTSDSPNNYRAQGLSTVTVPVFDILSFRAIDISDNTFVDSGMTESLMNQLNVNKPSLNSLDLDPLNVVSGQDVVEAGSVIRVLLNNDLIFNILLIVLSLAIVSYFLYGRKT